MNKGSLNIKGKRTREVFERPLGLAPPLSGWHDAQVGGQSLTQRPPSKGRGHSLLLLPLRLPGGPSGVRPLLTLLLLLRCNFKGHGFHPFCCQTF